MIVETFNVSLGGVVAQEIKLTKSCSFMFALEDNSNQLKVFSSGDDKVYIDDPAVGKYEIDHSSANVQAIAIEVDLAANTYNVFHKEDVTQVTWYSGDLTLAGDCRFIAKKFANMNCDAHVETPDWTISYTAGAKKPDGTAI